MDEFLKQIGTTLLNGQMDINYFDMFLTLTLSFVLSGLMTLIYRYTHTGLSYSRSFSMTMVLMSITIAFIMLIIGTNLARAFALVGALSIVRFRNAVKDSKDTSYIFVTMAIGMACGVKLYLMSVIFTVFAGVMILLFERFGFAEANSQERMMSVAMPVAFRAGKDVEKLISEFSRGRFSILSTEVVGADRIATYCMEIPKRKISADMLDRFHQEFPGIHFKLVSGFESFNI